MSEYTNELRRIATSLSTIAAELKKLNDREEIRDRQRAYQSMTSR